MSDAIPIERQIAAVKDELNKRRHFYPIWVKDPTKKLTQADADRRLAEMEAVLATLEKLRDDERRRVEPELPL